VAFAAWLTVIWISLRNLFLLWRWSSLSVDLNMRKINLYSSALVSSILSFLVGSSFGNYAYNDLFWTLLAIAAISIRLKDKPMQIRKIQT